MELNQASTKHEPRTSRKLLHLLFDRSSAAGNDIRGFVVLDRNHKKVGTICDVYCDHYSLKPRYVEIIPLDNKVDRSIMYPYDYVKWVDEDGPAFISSTASALFKHEEYDFDHIMQTEGDDLITFNEVLEADSREYLSHFDYQKCA